MTNNKITFACLTLGFFFGPISGVLATPVFNFRAAPYMGVGTSSHNEDVAQLHGAEFSVAPSWSLSQTLIGGFELGLERALFVTHKDHTTNSEMLTWATQQINVGLFTQGRLTGPWSLQAGWRYGSGFSRQRGHENTSSSHTSIRAKGRTQKHALQASLIHNLKDQSGWFVESALQRWQLQTNKKSQHATSEVAVENGLRLGSNPLSADDPWLQQRKISAHTLSVGVWWRL